MKCDQCDEWKRRAEAAEDRLDKELAHGEGIVADWIRRNRTRERATNTNPWEPPEQEG